MNIRNERRYIYIYEYNRTVERIAVLLADINSKWGENTINIQSNHPISPRPALRPPPAVSSAKLRSRLQAFKIAPFSKGGSYAKETMSFRGIFIFDSEHPQAPQRQLGVAASPSEYPEAGYRYLKWIQNQFASSALRYMFLLL